MNPAVYLVQKLIQLWEQEFTYFCNLQSVNVMHDGHKRQVSFMHPIMKTIWQGE